LFSALLLRFMCPNYSVLIFFLSSTVWKKSFKCLNNWVKLENITSIHAWTCKLFSHTRKTFSHFNSENVTNKVHFLTFPACFSVPIFFSNSSFNCSNSSSLRNLQEQVKKVFCYQKLFWPFTVWINFSSDLKNFANSRPSASNFFSQ